MTQRFLDLIINSYSNLSRDIWFLSLVTLINRSGTMVIIFLTIYLTDELNFTTPQAGIAMSCFGVGSVAGSYIGGWLTDRIGYYHVMFWTLFINGVLLFFLMYVTEFYAFCGAVLVLSTIGDSFRPASMASISIYSKPENHNRSLSLIRLAINLGFSIGAGAAGIISIHYGYSWLFIIDGVTCILGALFFLLVLKPKKEVLTKKQEKEAAEGISAYQDTNFIIFTIAVLLNAIVFMQLFSTIPLYLKDIFELAKDEIGYIMVANGLILAIFEMPLVYILEKRYKKMTLIIGGAILIGFSYLTFNLFYFSSLVIVLFVIAISFGELINFPFSNALALSRSNPKRRGQFMGLYSMSFSIGFIISPILGTKVAESWGFTNLWYLMTGLSILATLGYIYVSRRIDKEEVIKKDKLVTKFQ